MSEVPLCHEGTDHRAHPKSSTLKTKTKAETMEVRLPENEVKRNVERFQGGLVFKADRLLYHSTLGR